MSIFLVNILLVATIICGGLLVVTVKKAKNDVLIKLLLAFFKHPTMPVFHLAATADSNKQLLFPREVQIATGLCSVNQEVRVCLGNLRCWL